jgi:Tol biopolymer transport system component
VVRTQQPSDIQTVSILDLRTGERTDIMSSTPGEAEFYSSPEWSPGGRTILYARKPPDNVTYDLWLVDADGSNPHQITTVIDLFNPRWSPDGTRVAAAVGGSPKAGFDVYVFDRDGRNGRQVPNTSANEYEFADW